MMDLLKCRYKLNYFVVIIVAYKAHNINGVSDSSERCTFYNTSSTGRIQMYYHVWYLSGQI